MQPSSLKKNEDNNLEFEMEMNRAISIYDVIEFIIFKNNEFQFSYKSTEISSHMVFYIVLLSLSIANTHLALT